MGRVWTSWQMKVGSLPKDHKISSGWMNVTVTVASMLVCYPALYLVFRNKHRLHKWYVSVLVLKSGR